MSWLQTSPLFPAVLPTFEQQRIELWVHLHADFFSINTQWTLHIPGFGIHGFNQPQMENSIFSPWLGVHRCGGRTVCITILYERLEHPWILGCPGTNPSWILRDCS